MTTDLRTRFMSGLIFLVLIASAVLTVPARADSGSPPPAPPVPTGSTATTDVTKVPSAVTNTAEGDKQGRKVELGSQKAAYIAQPGDPIWCPSAVAVPANGAAGCTTSQTTLYDLISAIDAHTATVVPNKNGTIWIAGGADGSTSTITIDGNNVNFNTWKNYSLLLKGGWNGLGSGKVNTTNPSTFNQEIQIMNWNNAVTLSDIYTNNVASTYGLEITTSKNISLTRVHADSDAGYGALLDNRNGTGTITITNSQFNNDYDYVSGTTWLPSLRAFSHNAITLTNVLVFGGYGAYLDNSNASNKPVTIKASHFDGNNFTGLAVLSQGVITLTDVSASGNHSSSVDAHGAQLWNFYSKTAAPVTLTGTNIFDSNTSYGLSVESNGKITSGSLRADNNGEYGAELYNSDATTALSITLTGTSSFTGNVLYGLGIDSQGAITANNLFVDHNGSDGALFENYYSFTAPIKVTGTNWFSNNTNYGLRIFTNGAIALNNINANGNGLGSPSAYDGLLVDNITAITPQSITLTGANYFNQNTGNGASLSVTGAIKLSNVNAFNNLGGNGVTIDNTQLGSTKPQSVTLLGTNSLTNNHADNLDISTYGAITLNNLTASNSITGSGANLGYGGHISGNVTMNGANTFDNNHLDGLDILSRGTVLLNNLKAMDNNRYGVDISNTASSTSSPVTLKGANTFYNNQAEGLIVYSKGKVTISNLNASFNGNSSSNVAVLIENNDVTTAQPVTLTGTSTFNNNYGIGLQILSHGSVTVSNLTASNNGHDSSNRGAYIDNCDLALGACTGTGNIKMLGTNVFDFNYGSGLEVESKGTITASNLDASNNLNGFGADLYNMYGTSGVTLTGANSFNYNHSNGLNINSYGAITANNLVANNNGNNGAWISNNQVGAVGGINLKGSNVFLGNTGGDGLDLYSNGVVTVAHVTANYNYNTGLHVSTTGKVAVTCGSFMGNGTLTSGYGWETDSNVPSITLIGVDASGNHFTDYSYSSGTVVTSTAHTCTLP